jgi:hypothetical protein
MAIAAGFAKPEQLTEAIRLGRLGEDMRVELDTTSGMNCDVLPGLLAREEE